MTTTQQQRKDGAGPTTLAASPVVGGGTFAAGAQFWKVTALGSWGESALSNEATATIALNGQGSLTWVNPPGTTGVRIYRGTVTGGQNTMVAQIAAPVTAYSDTGTAGTGSGPPAAAAWTAVTKVAGVPQKSNVPAGLPAGLANTYYASLMGWQTGNTDASSTVQARNQKYAAAARQQLQEV